MKKKKGNLRFEAINGEGEKSNRVNESITVAVPLS